jgi:hypothetical protein
MPKTSIATLRITQVDAIAPTKTAACELKSWSSQQVVCDTAADQQGSFFFCVESGFPLATRAIELNASVVPVSFSDGNPSAVTVTDAEVAALPHSC